MAPGWMAWVAAIVLVQDTSGKSIKELVGKLGAEEPADRQQAMKVLVAGWKDWTEEDLKILKEAQKDSDAEVRQRATEALGRIGICSKVGAKVLEKVGGIDEVLYWGEAKECLQILVRTWEVCEKGELKKEDLAGLAEVAGGIQWGSGSCALVDTVGQKKMMPFADVVAGLLKDKESLVRSHAVAALAQLGAEQYTGAIAELIKDEDANVRYAAAESLGELGAKDYAGAIAVLLKDKAWNVRASATRALTNLGSKEHAGAIAELLKDDEAPVVRWAVIDALGFLGAKEYAGAIAEGLKDKDDGIRNSAAQALGNLGSKEHAGAIVELLKDNDVFVRWGAADALGHLGAKEYAGAIADLLKENNPGTRSSAARTLEYLGATDHAGAIAELLKDKESNVRTCAVLALGNLGGKDHVAAIVNLLKDEDYFVRDVASNVLGKLGAKEHVQAFGKLLDDPIETVRADAVRAIGRLGPPAQEAKAAEELGRKLDALQTDKEVGVQFAARLARIRWGRATKSEELKLLEGAWEPREVIEALAQRYEQSGYEAMGVVRELKENIKTMEELRAWMKGAGLELEAPKSLEVAVERRGRITVAQVLERASAKYSSSTIQQMRSETGDPVWMLWDRAWVIEGKTVRVMNTKEAVEYWRKRLTK